METNESPRHLAIIVSKSTLDMAYPGLILANAARMMGVDVTLFFTFWGLDVISREKVDHLRIAPVANPSMGMPTMLAGLPGVSGLATAMIRHRIEELDVPPVDEFIEMVHDAGATIYACKMSVDMMHLDESKMVPEVDGIVGATEFIEMTDGAQLLFI